MDNAQKKLKSSSKDCIENNCKVTDQKDDQTNQFGFLTKGDHENQISEGGEGALPMLWKYCKKNPGHPEYIPIESFSLKHLPEGHQDNDLSEAIKAEAALTVRLSVTMTSPDRPEFWPNTKQPYLLSNMRGKKIMRTGTGWVYGVKKFTDEVKHEKYGCTTCPCDKCKASDKPSKVWWEIVVRTAAHVVVDDIEASHTTLRLFYDREDSPEVILKDKVCVDYVNIERDWCMFTCVTCDENLGNKLMEMLEHSNDVWKKVFNKYRNKSGNIGKLNFIVSHPHGCSKQVSVGQWKDMLQLGEDKRVKQLTYTTCTCPGSSGANVHCMGNDWYNDHVHSGTKSGFNYSGVGLVVPLSDLLDKM